MLTSSRQGRQGTGFANGVQLQETICDKTYGFLKAWSENGCFNGHMKRTGSRFKVSSITPPALPISNNRF